MKWFLAIFIFLTSLVVFSQEPLPTDIDNAINYQTQKFKYILETSYRNYIDTLDIANSSEVAFKAFLKSLDSQSDYFSAKQLKDLQERNLGSSVGVGLQVTMLNDSAFVASITANSPADSAKISRGDILLFVDDKPVSGMSATEVHQLLGGVAGSKVSIISKSYRTGQLINYVLNRQEVPISSISTSFLVKGTDIGFIYSNRFSAKTVAEITGAISKLSSLGMKKLILDMRGNPGGYLDQVAMLLDEFLPKGYTLTYTDGRNPEYNLKYESTANGKYHKLPIVVIIDEQSASASEIFAGAMQDLDRGIVVGEKSFGKGTVQKMWTINDGSGFKLTVGEYHTPLGRQIDKDIQMRRNESVPIDESMRLQIGDAAFAQLKGAMELTGGRTKLPIFKSRTGRTIIGGGGISPDIKIMSDTTTLLTKVLQSRGILLEFTFNYFKKQEEVIRNKYKILDDFLAKYEISDDIYNELKQFSFTKNIWNDAMALQDEHQIKNLIKANIAHFLWDNYGYYAAKISFDKVFLEAVLQAENARNFVIN